MEGYTALVRSLNDELMVELMRKVGGKLHVKGTGTGSLPSTIKM